MYICMFVYMYIYFKYVYVCVNVYDICICIRIHIHVHIFQQPQYSNLETLMPRAAAASKVAVLLPAASVSAFSAPENNNNWGVPCLSNGIMG